MKNAVKKNYGSLKTLTVEGRVGGPCVILFHGYGADSADLLPLSDYIRLSKDVTWIFPEATMQVIIAPGFSGRAWYQIDVQRLERSLSSGEPVDLSQHHPPGLESASRQAGELYDLVIKSHSQVFIGGFSQGAMLATELALTHSRKPDGLVIMSGSLICEDRWKRLALSASGLKFIQTHGKNDALLGYEYAEKLFNLLTDQGLIGEFYAFSGGHEIPPKALEKIQYYLGALVR